MQKSVKSTCLDTDISSMPTCGGGKQQEQENVVLESGTIPFQFHTQCFSFTPSSTNKLVRGAQHLHNVRAALGVLNETTVLFTPSPLDVLARMTTL